MENKMTKELHLKLVEAFWDGKLEYNSGSSGDRKWYQAEEPPGIGEMPSYYRIRPEPKLRPWQPEEVPVGCLLKDDSIEYGSNSVSVLLCRRGAWIHYINHENAKFESCLLGEALRRFTHSTDHGKTWLPCGVEEAQ